MKCFECGYQITSMFHFSKGRCGKQKQKLLKKIHKIIDKNDTVMLKDIATLLTEKVDFLTKASSGRLIRDRRKERHVDSWKIMAKYRTGKNNPVFNDGTIEKIKVSVKNKWDNGSYADRTNGMKGKIGINNSRYNLQLHMLPLFGENQYKQFLSCFHNIKVCFKCGTKNKKINIHHIDENRKNYLPSNLEPLCVFCHMSYHYNWAKEPYTIITKSFKFSASHNLPAHEGLCNFQHGHEWKFDISIKKRVNKETGMVLDFSELKELVNQVILTEFDHSNLNEHLYNPTAENLLILIWFKLMYAGLKGIHSIRIWEAEDSFAEINSRDALQQLNNIHSTSIFNVSKKGETSIKRLKLK